MRYWLSGTDGIATRGTLIVSSTTAATKANTPPQPKATNPPNRSYNKPKIKLDGRAPIPTAKLNQPNASPFRSPGAKTATSALPAGYVNE